MKKKILNQDVTEKTLYINLEEKIIYVFKKHKKIFVMNDEEIVSLLIGQMEDELSETHTLGNMSMLFDLVADRKKIKQRVNRFKKLLTKEINEQIKEAQEHRRR